MVIGPVTVLKTGTSFSYFSTRILVDPSTIGFLPLDVTSFGMLYFVGSVFSRTCFNTEGCLKSVPRSISAPSIVASDTKSLWDISRSNPQTSYLPAWNCAITFGSV
ncbi:MAG: hypothetical protein AMQ22_02191 [Candidatus Methanofastidiosum methylothiophilum]|uniref:Uncharacterized protein n=1 Tax=Candidatus Methanofastidiosum methylothiophilum TaxID=1705564 RepID=A0A150IL78_9EURY|nr:MAG: hypothetical protein AMQ22_02191 [Candidatus Methanofastidiosum methylthiophilus]